jgi:hypothetical protein
MMSLRDQNNNPIIDVSINVLGSLNALPLNSLKVTLNNTNNTDINGTGVTLWYSNSSDFSTAYQVGSG